MAMVNGKKITKMLDEGLFPRNSSSKEGTLPEGFRSWNYGKWPPTDAPLTELRRFKPGIVHSSFTYRNGDRSESNSGFRTRSKNQRVQLQLDRSANDMQMPSGCLMKRKRGRILFELCGR